MRFVSAGSSKQRNHLKWLAMPEEGLAICKRKRKNIKTIPRLRLHSSGDQVLLS